MALEQGYCNLYIKEEYLALEAYLQYEARFFPIKAKSTKVSSSARISNIVYWRARGMALISEELKQYTILCSNNVEPIPLGERQIELLLRRMDKAEDAEKTLLNKLSQHNAYWSSRFGLNDAKPFFMLSEIVFSASWSGTDIYMEFKDQNPLKISNCKDIKALLIKFANKYDASICLQEQAYSGDIVIYGQPYPEHDWHHYALAMERQADKKIIRRLIKQYRQGNSTASSIEELSKLIAGYKT